MSIRRRFSTLLMRAADWLWPISEGYHPPTKKYDIVPKGEYDYVPKGKYVYGPTDRFLLVPKNRYRVVLLPDQTLSDELGVGWLTEDNSPEGYDQLWGEASNLQVFRAEADHVRDKLTVEIADCVAAQLTPGSAVVDIGCGVGDLLLALQQRASNLQVAGLDFSGKAVEGAQAHLPNGVFQQYVIDRTLPYDTDTFDIVTCTDVLEHLEHPKEVAAELVRICKPGGHVFIVVPDGDVDTFLGHYWFWNQESLHTLLADWHPDITRLPQSREFLAHLAVAVSASNEG